MRFLLFACLFILLSPSANAQDPVFTQYHAVPLRLNPAFAGSAFAPRFGAAYRNQWPGFGNAYQTYAAYYEQQVEKYNSGVGFSIEGDNAGQSLRKTTAASAYYAYRVPVNRHIDLKVGVEAGMFQASLNSSKLLFPDQIDPNGNITGGTPDLPLATESRRVFDASAGVLCTSEQFFLGASFKHFTSPRINFTEANDNLKTGLPIRFVLHGGAMIPITKARGKKDASFISPNFMFTSQGPYQQLNLGAYAGIGSVFGGLYYRHTLNNQDAVNLLIGMREGVFKLGLSYDMTVSQLAPTAGGAYEITIGVDLDRDTVLQQKRKNKQLNDCLHMFY